MSDLPQIPEYAGTLPTDPSIPYNEKALLCANYNDWMCSSMVPGVNTVVDYINNQMELNKGDSGESPMYVGEHDQTQTYAFLNRVTKNNFVYEAKQDVPVDISIFNTEYWLEITGHSVSYEGLWDSTVDYKKLSRVKSNGKLYEALQDVPSGTPLNDEAYWLKVTGDDAHEIVYVGVHNDANSYLKLQRVTHLNATFEAKKDVPSGISIFNTEYWLEITGLDGSQNQYYIEDTSPTTDVNPDVVGKIWINKQTGELWVCNDNTQDANVWVCYATGAVVKPSKAKVFDFFGQGTAVAFYTFDEENTTQMLDLGLQYHADRYSTLSEAHFVYDSDRKSAVLKAYSRSNASNYFIMPSDVITGSGTQTISFFYKRIKKGNYSVLTFGDGDGSITVYQRYTNDKLRFKNSNTSSYTDIDIDLTRFVCVSIAIDGDAANIFVDGVLKGAVTLNTPLSGANEGGRAYFVYDDNTDNQDLFLLDDIRIEDRVISQTEAADLSENG